MDPSASSSRGAKSRRDGGGGGPSYLFLACLPSIALESLDRRWRRREKGKMSMWGKRKREMIFIATKLLRMVRM